MHRKKSIPVISMILCLSLSNVGVFLLSHTISNGITHILANPFLLSGQIILPLVMTVGGLVGYIKTIQYQKARQAENSSRDFPADEAFQQIRSGIILADWSVFRTRGKKVIGTGLLLSLLALPQVLELSILIYAIQQSSAMFSQVIILILLLCLSLLFMAFIPFIYWKDAKDCVLLVTPNGFIYGNCLKPRQALRLKYRDVAEIRVVGYAIEVLAKDTWGKRYLDCSLFAPSTKEAMSALLTAFARYKADYPDGMLTAAPIFVQRFVRERNEG